MGCGSCGTKTADGSPAGCNNNGTCGTIGCNKLNVYDWLSDMVLPEGHKPFDIFEVRFKGSRKEFFRNVNNLPLKVGDWVAVEGTPGHDIGQISMAGELVRFQLRKKNVSESAPDIKTLYRAARPADMEKYEEVKKLEFETMHKSRTIALQLSLKMKLSDVEYQGDGKKATFFYTADERVDFRELIKKLAEEFKVRIEMRQIGMRQEASRLGGIGSCGRELCCSTWLTDFKIVSTSAARYQNLSLNPLKLAGQCGKLKCCLNYELDSYMDALKDIPDARIKLETTRGYAVHKKTDIFKRIMWYAYTGETSSGENNEPNFGASDSWVPMSVDRVKEIVALNKQNQKPEDLGSLDLGDDKPEHDYEDVVGQDSLTRMDNRKKKKKKKKKTGGGQASDVAEATSGVTQEQKPQQQQRQQPRPQQNNQQNRPQQQQKPQQHKPQQNRPPQQGQQRNNDQRGNRNQRQQQNTSSQQRPQNTQENKPREDQNGSDAPKPSPPSNRPPRQTPPQN